MYQATRVRFSCCLATLVPLLLLLSIFAASKTQAHVPMSSDCMRNPFASGCRGISAKRSQPTFYHDEGRQLANSGQMLPYHMNRGMHQAHKSLSELLFRATEAAPSGPMEQVISRPIIARLYLYEPSTTAMAAADEHPPLDSIQSHEEH